jgi:hypothetical protein
MDVRFVAHCGLKSDIVAGPKSAITGQSAFNQLRDAFGRHCRLG